MCMYVNKTQRKVTSFENNNNNKSIKQNKTHNVMAMVTRLRLKK